MLVTPRCVLQTPTGADTSAFVTLMTHPDVRRYLGGPASPERAAARAARLAEENDPTAWAVYLRHNPATGCVGLVQITPHHDGSAVELSYELLPVVWGVGLASEAVRAVIAHAFGSLGLTRLLAETQAANRPSRVLLERVGMLYDREIERFGEVQAIYVLGLR